MPFNVWLAPDGIVSADFLPHGGADNTACVQNASPDQYNESGLPGDRDLFTCENLPAAAIGTPIVYLILAGRHTGTSGTVAVRPVLQLSGGQEYLGAQVLFGVTYSQNTVGPIACPDGGAWTVAKVNGMRPGYELGSGASLSKLCRMNYLTPLVAYDLPAPPTDENVPARALPLARIGESTLAHSRLPALSFPLARIGKASIAHALLPSISVKVARVGAISVPVTLRLPR